MLAATSRMEQVKGFLRRYQPTDTISKQEVIAKQDISAILLTDVHEMLASNFGQVFSDFNLFFRISSATLSTFHNSTYVRP